MSEKYIQSIGRRKRATAQVRLYPGGSGKVTINEHDIKEYIKVAEVRNRALAPLKETGKLESVDLTIRAVGGGIRGQADAIMLGIARALVKQDEAMKLTMKSKGFLTRDQRRKERKKPGLHGARRATQWRKR